MTPGIGPAREEARRPPGPERITVSVVVKVQVESNNKIRCLMKDLVFVDGRLVEMSPKPYMQEAGEVLAVCGP